MEYPVLKKAVIGGIIKAQQRSESNVLSKLPPIKTEERRGYVNAGTQQLLKPLTFDVRGFLFLFLWRIVAESLEPLARTEVVCGWSRCAARRMKLETNVGATLGRPANSKNWRKVNMIALRRWYLRLRRKYPGDRGSPLRIASTTQYLGRWDVEDAVPYDFRKSFNRNRRGRPPGRPGDLCRRRKSHRRKAIKWAPADAGAQNVL